MDLTQAVGADRQPDAGRASRCTRASWPGLAGLILLFLYLLFYYRLLGIVAWFGMSIWAILASRSSRSPASSFGYALTLAGVAGLVISLGVTADSYIVFFERLKDEVRAGKSPRSAVQPAFKRAYKTIVAADIVTGIAAVVLYVTAVSSVRGFALTLGVATLLDLFVVYFFKRPDGVPDRAERPAREHARVRARGGVPAPDRRGRSRRSRREPPHHAVATYRGHTLPHFQLIEHRNVAGSRSPGVLIVLSLLGLDLPRGSTSRSTSRAARRSTTRWQAGDGRPDPKRCSTPTAGPTPRCRS